MPRTGKQTIVFLNRPAILSSACTAGPKEGEGPLGNSFDVIIQDPLAGQKSYEQAEQVYCQTACEKCLEKGNFHPSQVQAFLGGDLLNQIISSSMTARELSIPFLGLYGACSTITESLILGAVLCDGGFADPVLCAAGSHFCTAERQYRFPLEYASRRPPCAQWTVTAAGAYIIGKTVKINDEKEKVHISMATIGKVVDLGIADAGNMGAAMAPAAADTLYHHLEDTQRTPADYDCVITGDLGKIGSELLYKLMKKKNIFLNEKNHMDCGIKIFDEKQQVNAGGSGCGCAACVLSSYVLPKIKNKKWKRVAFMATGALLSTTSSQQGETIPGIAHLIVLERSENADIS